MAYRFRYFSEVTGRECLSPFPCAMERRLRLKLSNKLRGAVPRSAPAKRRGLDPSEMKKQSQAGGPRLKTIDAAKAANVTGGNQ